MDKFMHDINFPFLPYIINVIAFVYGPNATKLTYFVLLILAEFILDILISKKNKKKNKQNFLKLVTKIFAYSLYVFMAGAFGNFFDLGEKLRSFVLIILFVLQLSQLFVKLSYIGFEKESSLLRKPFLKVFQESEIGKMIMEDVEIDSKSKEYFEEVNQEIKEETKKVNSDEEYEEEMKPNTSSSIEKKEFGGFE